MANSAVNAASHHINTMALPAMPRIRPPRLLKGDPHPNNNPQPPGRPERDNLYWVQGRWKPPTSNAVDHQRAVQTRQAIRALRHQTHGLNIYAYRHMQTNQVVYSLSRTLEQNQVLKQLIYHGKKTVPAEVRKDLWTPYFSVHFPHNPAGAYAGLLAYQKLRDLSQQRQLSAPKSLIVATEEDVKLAKERIGNPLDLWDLRDSNDIRVKMQLQKRIPRVGDVLPKQVRAKKLMDQKATSVADVAFVLDWISSGPGPLERLVALETERVARHKERSRKARARINALNAEVEQQKQVIAARSRQAKVGPSTYDREQLPLTLETIKQLSIEHHSSKGRVHQLKISPDIRDVRTALREWKEYNPVDPKMINAAEHRQRTTVAKNAEVAALTRWFLQAETGQSDEQTSMWAFVKERRAAALQRFDEAAKEQRRNAALKRAEEEAKHHFSNLRSSETTPSSVSLEDLIAKKQQTALARLEQLEASRIAREQEQEQKEKPEWAANWDIKVYWSDLNDGLFAKSWPQNVVHAPLAPFAVAKDRSGRVLPSKSVHLNGGGLNDGWVPAWMLNGYPQPDVKPLFDPTSPEVLPSTRTFTEIPDRQPFEQPPPTSAGWFSRVKGIFGL